MRSMLWGGGRSLGVRTPLHEALIFTFFPTRSRFYKIFCCLVFPSVQDDVTTIQSVVARKRAAIFSNKLPSQVPFLAPVVSFDFRPPSFVFVFCLFLFLFFCWFLITLSLFLASLVVARTWDRSVGTSPFGYFSLFVHIFLCFGSKKKNVCRRRREIECK